MAEEEENKEEEEGEEGEQQETKAEDKGKLRKKRIIIVLIIVLVIALGGGAAAYFFLYKPAHHKKNPLTPAPIVKAAPIYIDMKEFIVNLTTNSNNPSFIKLAIALQVPNPQDQKIVEEYLPSLRDAFYFYLRSLRIEDLQGSAGMYRLKEQLLVRANKIVYPAHITDVLFKDIIVQ